MNHHESNLLRSKNNHVLIQSLLICGGDETLLTLCPILGSSCRKPLPKRRWQLWSQRGCPPQWLGLRHHWFLVLDNRLKGPPVLVSGASGSACWSSCEAKQRSWLCRDHVLSSSLSSIPSAAVGQLAHFASAAVVARGALHMGQSSTRSLLLPFGSIWMFGKRWTPKFIQYSFYTYEIDTMMQNDLTHPPQIPFSWRLRQIPFLAKLLFLLMNLGSWHLIGCEWQLYVTIQIYEAATWGLVALCWPLSSWVAFQQEAMQRPQKDLM